MAADDDPEAEHVVGRRNQIVAELAAGLRRIPGNETGEGVLVLVADGVSIDGAAPAAVDAKIDVRVVPERVVPNRRIAAAEHGQSVGPETADAVSLLGLTPVVGKNAVGDFKCARAAAY